MSDTGGEKTDEILGYDGGGPEGLPHSIIVTPEGPEGDAPVIEGRNAVEPQQEVLLEVEETDPTPRAKKKSRDAENKRPASAKSKNNDQMSLGFDKSEANEKKSGKKHGAKKTKR